MNCSCTDNGQRRSCPIVTLAGYTTFPSLAQHEDTDTRATCFQKVIRALISPQFAPESMHDWNHTETQASLHQPTHISDNTTTQTTATPKWVYRHFSSHATLAPQTKQIHVLVGRKRHLVPKASHAHSVLVPEANWNQDQQATQIHLSPSEPEYWNFFSPNHARRLVPKSFSSGIILFAFHRSLVLAASDSLVASLISKIPLIFFPLPIGSIAQ